MIVDSFPTSFINTTHHKIIVANRTSNHRLTFETGWWSTVTIAQFCFPNVVDNEAHLVLKCPLYNSITRFWFSFLFENVILGSLKSFQWDHQVDFSF